jgi:hypothetical protein
VGPVGLAIHERGHQRALRGRSGRDRSSMRVRPSVRDVGARRLNVRGWTHVRRWVRLGLGDGRTGRRRFPLRYRSVRGRGPSGGDDPGGESRRDDGAHHGKSKPSSIDAPDREQGGEQAFGAVPSRVPDADAGRDDRERDAAPTALDQPPRRSAGELRSLPRTRGAPARNTDNEHCRPPRPGHRRSQRSDDLGPWTLGRERRKLIEPGRCPDGLELLGGSGVEERSLHVAPRRVIGGLREISHEELEPRAVLRGAKSLRGASLAQDFCARGARRAG